MSPLRGALDAQIVEAVRVRFGHAARPQKKCGPCRNAGAHFRLHDGTHMHCGHPNEDVRDIPPKGTGWGTLRRWFNSCESWEAKP